MRTSFREHLPLWIGAVALPSLLLLVALLPNASAQSAATGAGTGHSAKSQSRCESDGPEQGDIHTIVLRDRGNRPGVKATFAIKGAAPDTRWDYEVSVTAGGSELVKVGSKRTGGRGNLSFSLINSTPGRAHAESGLSPHDGSQYCTMGLTARV
jgi:hypothetical protein